MKNLIATTFITLAFSGASLFAQSEKLLNPVMKQTKISANKIEAVSMIPAKKTNYRYEQKQGCIYSLNDNEEMAKHKSVSQTKPIEVKAFPNPVVSDLTVIITDALVSKSAYEVLLFDLQGKKVFSQALPLNQNIINLEGITAGTYILYVQKSGGVVLQEKIIKQ